MTYYVYFVCFPVAPSVPLCRIQGEAEYWQDITLTCVSEQGSPKPTYKWQSYSVENRPRQFPPKTTESTHSYHSFVKISLAEFKVLFISIYVKNHKMAHHLFCRWRCVTEDGALSLFNISREMSGFFICTSTNRIDSAKCNLTLAVMPGECLTWITCQTISDDPSHNYCTTSKYKMAKEALKSGLATVMRINHVSSPFHPVSMNMGATAGIIGGVLAGLLILGIVIYCCCCKKKGKEDKYAEEYVLLVRYVLSITSVYWLCPSGTLTQ